MLPDNVNVVEFVPVHTGDDPVVIASDPPTDAGDIVIVAVAEFADEHAPLVTTAL